MSKDIFSDSEEEEDSNFEEEIDDLDLEDL